jgi:hypothetical protein
LDVHPNRMKKNQVKILLRLSLRLAAAAVCGQFALAQEIFYSENFESPDSAINWNVNLGSPRDLATFGFDYSTVGIPPAPGATTTRGLKLQANRPVATGAKSGVSVSPKGQSFTNSYVVEFDTWANFPGPAPDGGSGSTQLTGAGIMTSGTTVNFDGTGDALWFAVTGESGATLDFRTYFGGVNQTAPELYTGGGQGHELAYYQTNFPGGVSAPAAQVALFSSQTGQTRAGTVGWQWRHVRITKNDNLVTWDIDNIRISTVNLTDNGIETLGGNNILLVQSDINNSTTSAALDPMLFGLIDNLRVTSVPLKVSAIQTDPNGGFVDTLPEGSATVAAFKIVRPVEDIASDLNINFTLSGTATRGDAGNGDYFIRTNGVIIPSATTVTIPSGSDNVLVEIVANEDNVSELAETIIFDLATGAGYAPEPPTGGAITITDNDAPTVDISAVVFDQMFEGNTNDFVRVTLQRRGDVNAGPFDVNLSYSGTATAGQDFTPVNTVTFNPGDLNVTVDIHPINDTVTEERETVIISVVNGTGYAVGANSVLTAGATLMIVDDDVPDGTILYKDDFTADSAANWTLLFGSIAPEAEDYVADFGREYAASEPLGFGIPPAPHASSETLGLFMSVNKLDLTDAAAGVNAYLNGQDFSGNYAVRFDMYLMQNNTATLKTENSIFGINHDGTKTNWYSNATNNVPITSDYDGIWASVVADASLLPGSPRARAYQIFTAPGVSLGGLFGPTLASGREASTLASVFHRPPWTSADGPGSPSNATDSETPSWAQVELRQVNGVVTLSINNTDILSYTNTTASTHGKVMLGYDDSFNSTGSGGGGFVIYDNFRVVRLAGGVAADVHISTIARNGNNVTIDFTAGSGEPATAFKLVSAPAVTGPYTDDATATITSLGGSNYRTTPTATDAMRFYQVRRAP